LLLPIEEWGYYNGRSISHVEKMQLASRNIALSRSQEKGFEFRAKAPRNRGKMDNELARSLSEVV
jgi:hypothetical protein